MSALVVSLVMAMTAVLSVVEIERFLKEFFLLLFAFENALSVLEKGPSLFEFSANEVKAAGLIFTLNVDKAIFTFAVLYTGWNLPERDESGVKAVIKAVLIAAENFGGMLFKELSEFLVETGSFGEVVIEGRLHQLDVLISHVLEESVDSVHVLCDIIHAGADDFRVDLLEFELAAAGAKALLVEVERLTTSHRVKALDSAVLVALLVNLEVLHN